LKTPNRVSPPKAVQIRDPSLTFSDQDLVLVSQQSTPSPDDEKIETMRKFRRDSQNVVIKTPDGDTVTIHTHARH
jgi:hypothetical protein